MERKLGDTFFFPTVFRVVILICVEMVEDKDRKTHWSYILENLNATVQNWELIYLGT